MTFTEREYNIVLQALTRFSEDNRAPFDEDVKDLAKRFLNHRIETRRTIAASLVVNTEPASPVGAKNE